MIIYQIYVIVNYISLIICKIRITLNYTSIEASRSRLFVYDIVFFFTS
ncbi:MAG: hypothetical protein K0S47_4243 [Herbinix sp.]|jgi:hypothetical protein|nr:hypothetical protein [Herbinix sp.]